MPLFEFLDPSKINSSSLSDLLDKTKSTNQSELSNTVTFIIDWITTYVPYGVRPVLMDELVKWADSGGSCQDLTYELKFKREVYEAVSGPIYKSQQPDEFERKWEIKSKKNCEELEAMIQASPTELLTKITNNDDVFDCSEAYKGEILLELSEHLAGSDFKKLLEAIPHNGSLYYPDKYLLNLIEKNRGIPVVEEWIEEDLPTLLHNKFLGFFSDDTYELFSNMISDPQKRIGVLAQAIKRVNSSLYPSSWMRLFKVAIKTLSAEKFVSVFGEAIKFYATDISNDYCQSAGDNPFTRQAEFFYELFGHPDNRIRWKAFFALRNAYNHEAESVVDCVVSKIDSYKGDYWMSAKQWGLFWLLNIAHNNPTHLYKHAPKIASYALDESFPHAAIQELSKQVTLFLLSKNESLLPKEDANQIARINTPIEVVSEKRTSREHRSGERYSFDLMDTMPYWFSRLSHCFGYHRCDVADIAEKWICDEWGLSESDVREKDRTSSYSWELTSHRQGHWPTVEKMSRYYDRHGLYMAAGEMIRTKPVAINYWGESPWDDWLNWWTFGADPQVTSDLLSPQPHDVLELASSYLPNPRDEWLAIDRAQLLSMVFPSKDDEKQVVGGGDITIYHKQRGGRGIDISSTLVPHALAGKLADQINSSADAYDCILPIAEISYSQDLGQLYKIVKAGDYESDRWEHTKALYKFSPRHWLVDIYSERELHRDDSHWQSYSRRWLMPGKDFIDYHNAQPSSDYKSYLTPTGYAVTTNEVWDDSSFVDNNYDFSTNGYRLWASKSHVLAFLKHMDRSLVIKVELSASRAESHRRSEDRLEPVAFAFVLTPDGESI